MMLIKLVRGHFSDKPLLLVELVTSEPFLGLFFHIRGDILWDEIDSLFTRTSMSRTSSFTSMNTLRGRQGFGDAIMDDVMRGWSS